MTTSDLEWPRVTTSDHEWPRMTTSDHGWPRVTTSHHESPRVTMSEITSKNVNNVIITSLWHRCKIISSRLWHRHHTEAIYWWLSVHDSIVQFLYKYWLLSLCSFRLIILPFSFVKAKKNPSGFIKRVRWGSKLQARTMYIFSECRATKHSCSVTCSRKSQRQTVASALRYSYALPSDLTRDCVHALMLLFAPAGRTNRWTRSSQKILNALD